MEWVKKDGNLEERVIIYFKFRKVYDFIDDVEISAAYVTVNIDNIKNLSCFSEERLKQDAAFDEEYSGLTISEGTHVLYFDVESEEKLLKKPEWILYVGEYTEPERCNEEMDLGVEYYLLQLEEIYKEEPIVEEEKTKDYETILTGKLRGYIVKKYIRPMIDIAASQETLEFIKVRKRFIGFSVDTPFYKESIELCRNIEQNREKQDPNKINNYLVSIIMNVAAERDELELAAEMRDKIRRLE
tara:strand:+ start:549 stop:1277 length:729 start_codon:yes stop_codon:yes gene_type:complete